jgi:hypothetical protein
MYIPRVGEQVYVDELRGVFVVAWVDDETQTVDLRACNKTHSKAAAAPASYCCWRTFIWLMCSFLMRCGI